ncbi:MAG: Zn-dependent hydrolase [Desulfovibrionaceae bacterium]|nr:Zn-dependent hydrolase [Desulfovibrionaceae bacterium]
MSACKESSESAARVMKHLQLLSFVTERAGEITRRYLTPQHQKANALVGNWMKKAGMKTHVDSAGNIIGVYDGMDRNAPAVLFGSHLDTVRNAGAYDGTLGVLSAIEAVHCLHEQHIRLTHPIWIIGFADEEGTRFGVTFLGSAAVAGHWNSAWFDVVDMDGVSMKEAMLSFGLDPDRIEDAAIPRSRVKDYYELHIEQGSVLDASHRALGVVSCINESRRFQLSISGETGHSGTTPMSCRRDAVFGAAEVISAFEKIASEYGDRLYCTVGSIHCAPNLANCIAGSMELRLDIRAGDQELLDILEKRLFEAAQNICRKRRLLFESTRYFFSPLVHCCADLMEKIRKSLEKIQGYSPVLQSGAAHDASEIASVWPMAMIFMRCAGGKSHCPEESVRQDDVRCGIEFLLDLLCSNY